MSSSPIPPPSPSLSASPPSGGRGANPSEGQGAYPSETEILDAFEAHIRGDKTIDQYLLFHYISREIDRRNKKFLGRHLQWEAACLDKWHRQFQYGACLDPLSDHDIRQRVLILLTSDLSPFEPRNESKFKQKLLRNHLHLLTPPSPERNQVY